MVPIPQVINHNGDRPSLSQGNKQRLRSLINSASACKYIRCTLLLYASQWRAHHVTITLPAVIYSLSLSLSLLSANIGSDCIDYDDDNYGYNSNKSCVLLHIARVSHTETTRYMTIITIIGLQMDSRIYSRVPTVRGDIW